LIVSAVFWQPFRDNSYLWHVRAGDAQLSANAVLTADPFSFTKAGEVWRTQSWLLELGYSRVDGRFGLGGADWFVAIFGVMLLVFTGLIIYGISKSVAWSGLYLVMSSVLFAGFLNPRPALAGLVAFAAVVLTARDERLRWSLPLLFWIWASAHGSFVIGLAYLGVWAIAERPRWAFQHLSLSTGATLLTAHGWGILVILRDFLGNREGLDVLQEWRPTSLLDLGYLPLLLGLLLLIRLAQIGRLRTADWWYILAFVPLALSASRAAPMAWIALIGIFARFRPISDFERRSTVDRRLVVLLGVTVMVLPLVLASPQAPDERRFPVALLGHLESERVFHDDVVGGWLTYVRWPASRVFIDDRAELFGSDLVEMVDVMNGSPTWRETFDRWGIEEAVVPLDSGLGMQLTSEGWHVAEIDAVAGYYLMRSG
jgi:hypothetical protein